MRKRIIQKLAFLLSVVMVVSLFANINWTVRAEDANAGDISINIENAENGAVQYKIGEGNWQSVSGSNFTLQKDVELQNVTDEATIYFQATPNQEQSLDTNEGQNWIEINGQSRTDIDTTELLAGTYSISYEPTSTYSMQIKFNGGNGIISYGKDGRLGFNIANGDKGDVFFQIGDGIKYRVGGDETNNEDAIIGALQSTEFQAGNTIKVWAAKYGGKVVGNFDVLIDGQSVFTTGDERTAARTDAEGESGYTFTVPEGYASTQLIEFAIEFRDETSGGGDDSDVSYTEDATISEDVTKNDITVSAGTLTIDNCSVRVDHKLVVESGATIVGTSASSKLIFAGGAFSNGIALYYEDEKISDDNSNYFSNNGDGPVEFIWDTTSGRWVTEQPPAEGGGEDLPWYTVSYGSSANLNTKNGKVYAERVHIGDITFSSIESEYNASEDDEIYSMKDTIFHQKTPEEENDPNYVDPLMAYGMGGSDGDIMIHKDVSGVSIDFKFIPDFGYQLTNIYTNENETDSLLNDFAAAETVSSFTFNVIQGKNVHFEVKFEKVDNKVTGNAGITSSAKIESTNAAASGTLEMKVNNATASSDIPSGSEALAAYDITLTNVVSKGGDRGSWNTQLEDLGENVATVTLPVDNADTTNYTYTVIRAHGEREDTLEATVTDGAISFDTNKFSTYTIVKTPVVKSIETAEITLGDALTYNGAAQIQTIASVKVDGRTLTQGTDYTITGNAKKDAGTYTLTVTGTGNYTGTATKQFTIEKATLTPALSGTTTKVYDNTTAVTATNNLTLAVTGLMSNETVTVTASGYAYDNANVGFGKTITATGVTISGDAAKNYVLSGATATVAGGVITQATATITLSNLSETTQAPTGVKAALNPADASAQVVIEYLVLDTPAVAATPEVACNVTHAEGCASLAEGKTITDCNCAKAHTSHNEECGYKAATSGSPATFKWGTTRPTTPGAYPLRVYLPTETANVAAIPVQNAVTGTYTLTQYTAPSDGGSNSGSDSSSDSDSDDDSDSSSGSTTTPAPATPTQAETTPPASTANTTTRRPVPATEESNTETASDKTIGVSSEEGAEGWTNIKTEINDKLANAVEAQGDEEVVVTVEMNGENTVPSDVFETIAGQDITVTFDMGNGIVWAVNGMDVTADSVEDINFSASTGDGVTAIPAELITGLTEERFSMELTLEYEGEFGFTAVMSVNVDKKNAGKYANLFYFNPKTKTMEFICSAPVKEDGTTDLSFTHASDYIIVVDEVAMSVANNLSMDKVVQPVPQETPSELSPVELGAAEKDAFNPLWILVIGIVVLLIGGIAIVATKMKKE